MAIGSCVIPRVGTHRARTNIYWKTPIVDVENNNDPRLIQWQCSSRLLVIVTVLLAHPFHLPRSSTSASHHGALGLPTAGPTTGPAALRAARRRGRAISSNRVPCSRQQRQTRRLARTTSVVHGRPRDAPRTSAPPTTPTSTSCRLLGSF